MHEARWRSKQVADSMKGQSRHRIGMSRFVKLGDVPVDELSARGTSTHGLGNAQVVADRNSPGNLNDFGCPTKKGLCQHQVANIGSYRVFQLHGLQRGDRHALPVDWIEA